MTNKHRDNPYSFHHSLFLRGSSFGVHYLPGTSPARHSVRNLLLAMSPQAKTVPRHIAIIMDGNGRWAKSRGLARIKGHEAGAQAVRECVEGCGELKVEYLTLYAFSAENWQRPKSE